MMADGLNEIIFHLMWAKDNLLDTAPEVYIPHTIIYKFYSPRYWYFTARDGTIRRKTKDKLTQEHIKKEFLKKPSRSGIIATLVSIENGGKIAEFLTRETFLNFLDNRKIESQGLLQKFVDPIGKKNSSVTASWTANFCLLEKIENKLDLYDPAYDLYERAVTVQGREYHFTSTPLRGVELTTRCYKAADSIAAHISAVTFEKYKILRMSLQLKIDENLRVWFLLATSVKFSKSATLTGDAPAEIKLPRYLENRRVSLDSRKPAVMLKNTQCAFCSQYFAVDTVTLIAYKTLLQVYGAGEIPFPIQNVHSKLKLAEFLTVKKKEKFLERELCACYKCYLKFIKERKASGAYLTKINSEQMIGTGPLNPFKTRKRQNMISTSKPQERSYRGSSRAVFTYTATKTTGGELLISPLTPILATRSSLYRDNNR